jgi:hypothetical protein
VILFCITLIISATSTYDQQRTNRNNSTEPQSTAPLMKLMFVLLVKTFSTFYGKWKPNIYVGSEDARWIQSIFLNLFHRTGLSTIKFLYLHLGELGSDLDLDTVYPDWVVSSFSSVPSAKFRGSTSIRPRSLHSKSFPIHCSFYYSALWSLQCRYRQSRKVIHAEIKPVYLRYTVVLLYFLPRGFAGFWTMTVYAFTISVMHAAYPVILFSWVQCPNNNWRRI